MKGRFITFEGIDGSGKTTIAKLLYEKIGKNVVLTAEPTKTWLGDAVNKALENKMDAITVALLFMADRNEHVKKIKKWIEEGKIVICDRYIDSTFAYQSIHLEMKNPEKWIYKVHEPFLFKPHLTFLLKIHPEKAMERINSRKRILYEKTKFLEEVQKKYIEMAEKESRFVIINAEKSREKILDECFNILKEKKII